MTVEEIDKITDSIDYACKCVQTYVHFARYVNFDLENFPAYNDISDYLLEMEQPAKRIIDLSFQMREKILKK